MTTPSGTAKICVVCGEDCANKPRTKDAKGRYYCKPCHERALARRGANLQPAFAHDGGKLETEPAPIEVFDQLIAIAPPVTAAEHCPKCGFALTAGGVICANCGYNIQTRSALRTKLKKGPRASTGGVIWPPLVGIVSMILGGAGVLLYGFFLLMALIGALEPGHFVPSLVSSIPASCLITMLAAWLLRDGWRILRRESEGVKWIRFWAMTKLLIYGTCLSLLMAIPGRELDKALATLPKGTVNVTASDIKAGMLLIMLWYLAWPIFTLVFFFVPRIQNDVEQW